MRLFYTILFTLSLINLHACKEDETDNTVFKCESNTDINTNMLSLVNQARAQERACGNQLYLAAPALQWNQQLVRAARFHATDMANNDFFDHTGSDDSVAASRIQNAGYSWVAIGENLAGALETSAEVVNTLLRSPIHCAVIMNPQFREMGAACQSNTESELILYWAQEFGSR
jgi:uncharacterized protein YkwD